MKSRLKTIYLLATAVMITLAGCDSAQKEKSPVEHSSPPPETQNTNQDIKKISEALGNFIGKNLNSPGIHFDVESMIKGIRDGATGKPSRMNDQEYEQAMNQLQQQAVETISSKNLEDANLFIEKNATSQGVIEIIPGKLQYMILEEGTEPTVTEESSPQINYTGKYIDGTVFGSSEAAGGPITVPLNQTIPGFSKGILGMKEGEKRRLFVHPDVGYGTSGQLLPNSLLIFDIEVVKTVSPEKTDFPFNGAPDEFEDNSERSEDDTFEE